MVGSGVNARREGESSDVAVATASDKVGTPRGVTGPGSPGPPPSWLSPLPAPRLRRWRREAGAESRSAGRWGSSSITTPPTATEPGESVHHQVEPSPDVFKELTLYFSVQFGTTNMCQTHVSLFDNHTVPLGGVELSTLHGVTSLPLPFNRHASLYTQH